MAGDAVADSMLTVSMSELHRLLGETVRAPQYIAPERRRGYRFIAPVTPISDTRLAIPSRSRCLPVFPLQMPSYWRLQTTSAFDENAYTTIVETPKIPT